MQIYQPNIRQVNINENLSHTRVTYSNNDWLSGRRWDNKQWCQLTAAFVAIGRPPCMHSPHKWYIGQPHSNINCDLIREYLVSHPGRSWAHHFLAYLYRRRPVGAPQRTLRWAIVDISIVQVCGHTYNICNTLFLHYKCSVRVSDRGIFQYTETDGSVDCMVVSVCFSYTRQVTRATHVRNRICPRVKLILKIIIILLIIFLGFIN